VIVMLLAHVPQGVTHVFECSRNVEEYICNVFLYTDKIFNLKNAM